MKKSWARPEVRRLVAGAAEAQRSSGNPDAKFDPTGNGKGGQYS